VVAFAVFDDSAGTDELVVLCETHDDDESRRLDIERKVLGAVTAHVGVRPDRVVMLAPGTLTKTSSGKLQRVAAKQRYLEDRLDAPEGTKMKWAKLWLVRSAHRLRGIKA
jgi:fatty-acyl-CoA synthase